MYQCAEDFGMTSPHALAQVLSMRWHKCSHCTPSSPFFVTCDPPSWAAPAYLRSLPPLILCADASANIATLQSHPLPRCCCVVASGPMDPMLTQWHAPAHCRSLWPASSWLQHTHRVLCGRSRHSRGPRALGVCILSQDAQRSARLHRAWHSWQQLELELLLGRCVLCSSAWRQRATQGAELHLRHM